MFPFSSDYKRAQDGDIGLNTGGMGAYTPSAGTGPNLEDQIARDVVDRVLSGMRERGTPYVGTLYPGLMITDAGPHVIEFNARFGDPETQVLIPRLESDLFDICTAAARGELATADVRWSGQAAVGIVIASGGYPATYKVGHLIEGDDAVDPGVLVFHAGTKQTARGLETCGGRVLTVVALGSTVAEARAKAYDNAARIRFMDSFYRKDIAAGVAS
jgi:phosphoribosylamine--glycine ligase